MSFKLFFSPKMRPLFLTMVLISAVGIALGLAVSLISLSVMSGFEQVYQKSILAFNAHIVLVSDTEIDDPAEIQKKMVTFSDRGFISSTPFVFREGLGLLPDDMTGIVLKGVDPFTMKNVYDLHYRLFGMKDQSQLEQVLETPSSHEPPVLLGKDLFERFFPLEIPKNPVVRLLIPKPGAKGRHVGEYAQSFRVVGTFESGLYEFDAQFALMSYQVMDWLFELKGRVNGFEVKLDDPLKARNLAPEFEEAFKFRAVSWEELNAALFQAMKMERKLFVVMMILILLIAAFNVMATIFLLVFNRQTEMALLKALGATRNACLRIFSYCGFLITGVGIFLGVVLSVLVLKSLIEWEWLHLDPQIYFVSHIPVAWPKGVGMLLILFVWGLGCGISWLSARYLIQYGRLSHLYR